MSQPRTGTGSSRPTPRAVLSDPRSSHGFRTSIGPADHVHAVVKYVLARGAAVFPASRIWFALFRARLRQTGGCGDQCRAMPVEAASSVAGFEVDGFSTCPQRRHSRRASILTMFMPHFGQGGRTSKQVKASLLVGRKSFVPFRGEALLARSFGNAWVACIPSLK